MGISQQYYKECCLILYWFDSMDLIHNGIEYIIRLFKGNNFKDIPSDDERVEDLITIGMRVYMSDLSYI